MWGALHRLRGTRWARNGKVTGMVEDGGRDQWTVGMCVLCALDRGGC
jgi:hypothetical protein